MSEDLSVKGRLEIAQAIVQMFRLDRYLFLLLSFMNAAMLTFVGYQTITKPGVGKAVLSLLFGSAGIVTFNIARLLTLFNSVLEKVFLPDQSRGRGRDGR